MSDEPAHTPADGDRTTKTGAAPAEPYYMSGEQVEISPVRVLNVLLRHRWKTLLPAIGLVVVVAALTVLSPSRYTSDVSLTTDTGGDRIQRLSGIASQIGIDIPRGGEGQSPQFYAELLRSRRILEQAADTEYRLGQNGPGSSAEAEKDRNAASSADSGRAVTLADHYQIESRTRQARVAGAAGRLKEAMSVSTDAETGLIEFSVTTGDPMLSRQVAARLVELLKEYNLQVRQSRASAEAEFTAERLDEARAELRRAEDSLERFLEQNRRFQNSPQLVFEHERLQRQVQLKQSVVNSLAQSYEQSRIARVRNTPVITVVNRPKRPLGPDSSGLRLNVALALVFGGMAGVAWALGAEYMGSVREERTDDYREFLALRRSLFQDLKSLGQRIRGFLRPGGRESGTSR